MFAINKALEWLYILQVKSIVNREMYLLERSKIRLLQGNITSSPDDILEPGTDVVYYNQLAGQWEQGIVIGHDNCGYAQVRWKIPGMDEEFVYWFESANVSTTPPNTLRSKKLVKPGLFTMQDSSSNNEDEGEDVRNSPLLQPSNRKRSQSSITTKLFARIRSKQPAPSRPPPVKIPEEDEDLPVVQEYTVEHLDPQYNPAPPKFNGIPPKWLAPTPVYFPYPMYVPVPVLIPHYAPRPPSISYPFFPGQMFEQHFEKTKCKGIPPHKGAFRLFRIIPKRQSKLMSRQPFSLSGRKLSAYEPKSLEVDRKIEYLPPYESIVHSKFKSPHKKSKDSKKYSKVSSSDSSEEDELSLYSHRSGSAESDRSKEQGKSFRPGSGSSGKVRVRASSELIKSLITQKKLSDLPSSSPTIKEPGKKYYCIKCH